MAKCVNCGEEAPEAHNYCNWDCSVEAAKKAGGKVIAPNGLPVRCIRHDNAMLEHEHADHPFYKFPVRAVFYKTPQEMLDSGESFWVDGNGLTIPKTVEELEYDCVQDHALLYTDGSVALTMYECCYALFSLRDGRLMCGSLWEKGHWHLSPESLEKVRATAPVRHYG